MTTFKDAIEIIEGKQRKCMTEEEERVAELYQWLKNNES